MTRSSPLFAILLSACAGLLSPPCQAASRQQEPSKDATKKATTKKQAWQTDAVHGPSRKVEFNLQQGTWMNLDVSPIDGSIVFDLLGDIYLLPAGGGKATALVQGPAFTVQPRFSPDGKRIAFTSDAGGADNLWVMDANGQNPIQVTKESFRLLNNPAWTPDSRYLVGRKHFTSQRSLGAGEMWLYPVDGKSSGIQLTKKRSEQHDAGEPEVSKDGKYVYFSQDVSPGKVFEYNRDPNGIIYAIQRLDLVTGKIETVSRAPGGSVRPELSPNGKELAFVRRVRDKTCLFIRDLDSGKERKVFDGLSKDGQETWSIFGVYPNFGWLPDGGSLVIWAKGDLLRIDAVTGEATPMPFEVVAKHEIRDALRFPQAIGGKELPVRVIRWPQVAPDGKRVFFQALGQIYQRELPDGKPQRVTESMDREYYPCLSPDGSKLVFTTWNDKSGGKVMMRNLQTGETHPLVEKPGHYANPAFDLEGERVVYQRLSSGSTRGSIFTLRAGIYLMDLLSGELRFVTKKGSKPRFHPKQDRILLMDREGKKAALVSVNLTGHDRQVLFTSEHATDILLSPTGHEVAWEELFHVYLSPAPATGAAQHLSPKRKDLPAIRLSKDAGEFLAFDRNGKTLYHSLAASLQGNDVAAALAHMGEGQPSAQTTDLGFVVAADMPKSNLVLRGARIITMEGEQVIDEGFVHVSGNRIAAIGPMQDYSKPDGAKEIDVRGKTIMPGIVDVHAHMPSGNAGMLPQNNWAYLANLAFGVTTTHDPSHDTKMVFAASELEKSGRLLAPRIFSTGTILYGAEGNFKAVINSLDDARSHLRRLKAFGAFSVKSYNQPRRNQRQQVIAAAAELKMMVCPEGGSMFFHNLSMILDGHTTLEHALPVAPLYEDVLQLFAASRTAYNPTLVVGYGGLWGENYWYEKTNVWENRRLLNFVPRGLVDPRSRRRNKFPESDYHHLSLARSAAVLAKRGVAASVSAHGQMQGLCSHWDLWMFQQGGLSNHEALRCATTHPARALGFDRHVGSLAKGKLADLLVLDKNPLDNIRNSEAIDSVMKNGRLYDAMTLRQIAPNPGAAPQLPFLGMLSDVGGASCMCHATGGGR